MIQVRTTDEFRQILKDNEYVFIDWYATWCRPCKAIAPFLNEVEQRLKDEVKFIKIDVEDCEGLALKHGVRSMPTFHIYKNEKKIAEAGGADPNVVAELLADNVK